VEVLFALSETNRAFASVAEDPAAYLALKVSYLSNVDVNAETRGDDDDVPVEITDVLGAGRLFTNAVERVGSTAFCKAASNLRPNELTQLRGRLDEVHDALASLVEDLPTCRSTSSPWSQGELG